MQYDFSDQDTKSVLAVEWVRPNLILSGGVDAQLRVNCVASKFTLILWKEFAE